MLVRTASAAGRLPPCLRCEPTTHAWSLNLALCSAVCRPAAGPGRSGLLAGPAARRLLRAEYVPHALGAVPSVMECGAVLLLARYRSRASAVSGPRGAQHSTLAEQPAADRAVGCVAALTHASQAKSDFLSWMSCDSRQTRDGGPSTPDADRRTGAC